MKPLLITPWNNYERFAKVHPDKDGWVALHITPNSNNSIHFHSIMSPIKGKNYGTHGLKWVHALADKHGLKLHGMAKAFGHNGMTTTKLKSWYKKHGWDVRKGGFMSREPK